MVAPIADPAPSAHDAEDRGDPDVGAPSSTDHRDEDE